MYFLIEDDDLLEKYNIFWDRVTADIKKEFDSGPVYNKNFFKEIPKVDSNYTCLAAISLDFCSQKR